MSLSYEPLWAMLDELDVSKMEFAKIIGMSNATLAKLGKNEPITLTIIDKICNAFDCKIENIVQHIPDRLLNQKQSSLPLKKGDIVIVEWSDSTNANSKTDDLSGTYVVLQIREEIINKISTWKYICAPITNAPYHYLSMFFEDILINNKVSFGYISLDKLTVVPSEHFKRIVGKMPSDIIKKVDTFLDLVKAF